MSSTQDLSKDIVHMSKMLVEEGKFNWLRDQKHLQDYKIGLENWVSQLEQYLEDPELTKHERNIAEGEILRFKGTLKNISHILTNKF